MSVIKTTASAIRSVSMKSAHIIVSVNLAIS